MSDTKLIELSDCCGSVIELIPDTRRDWNRCFNCGEICEPIGRQNDRQ